MAITMTPVPMRKYGSVDSTFQWLPNFRANAARAQITREWEIAADSPSSAACRIVPRTAMMKAAIIVLECPGSRPCSAPSTMATGR